VAAEDGAPLHFAPKEPTTSLTSTASSPWPAGEVLPQEPLPIQIDAAKLKQAVDTAFEPARAMTSAYVASAFMSNTWITNTFPTTKDDRV
jgi:hypothetical protein